MNYELWFWVLLAFWAGYFLGSKPLFYMGSDEEKYKAARIAVLMRPR